MVSTHSRPKAAAAACKSCPFPLPAFQHTAARRRLLSLKLSVFQTARFQHTAARRRLLPGCENLIEIRLVSTHSRPKAAAAKLKRSQFYVHSFNTQPPEGGCIDECHFCLPLNSFNTQPPEGGCPSTKARSHRPRKFQHTAARRRLPQAPRRRAAAPGRFNTQPPEGGCLRRMVGARAAVMFQHTAARRRLRAGTQNRSPRRAVSTHSRPKAAAPALAPLL